MRRLRTGNVLSVMLALEMLASASALPDLHSLETPRRRDPSPDTDLNLNKTLKLSGTTIKPLPETLPTQVDKGEEVKSSNDLAKETNYNLNLPSNSSYVFESKWKKRLIAPLQLCDNLKEFMFIDAKVEELPDRWVAACSRLEHLTVWGAKNLTNLPANLLEGATALKYLEFTRGVLEFIPDGFLVGAPNLRHLHLSDNRLTMLTSASLVGPAGLESLYLRKNQLRNEAMEGIAPLISLKTLSIANNNQLSNLCERNGYSMFKNLIGLRKLYINDMYFITHLCRDWSEMKFLEFIDFSKTSVTELDFADVYLTKDPSVEAVTYMFDGVRIAKLRITEDEYELGDISPPKTNLAFISDSREWSIVRHENFNWIPNMPCLKLKFVEN